MTPKSDTPSVITSLQNDRVKLAHALQTQAKARRKEGKIALEGARLVADAVERGGSAPDFALVAADFDSALIERLVAAGADVLPVSDEVMRHVSATEEPPGVVAVFPMPDRNLPAPLTRALILDNLRDPGNLGTMLRTAAAANVQAVLLSPGCVDAYNPKVLRAGMGAHFRLAVAELSWAQIEQHTDGAAVYLADMTGDVTYEAADWAHPWALIIGSEAHGASEGAVALAHQRVVIPMASGAESLNAAVAAGILLFEARRQAAR